MSPVIVDKRHRCQRVNTLWLCLSVSVYNVKRSDVQYSRVLRRQRDNDYNSTMAIHILLLLLAAISLSCDAHPGQEDASQPVSFFDTFFITLSHAMLCRTLFCYSSYVCLSVCLSDLYMKHPGFVSKLLNWSRNSHVARLLRYSSLIRWKRRYTTFYRSHSQVPYIQVTRVIQVWYRNASGLAWRMCYQQLVKFCSWCEWSVWVYWIMATMVTVFHRDWYKPRSGTYTCFSVSTKSEARTDGRCATLNAPRGQ